VEFTADDIMFYIEDILFDPDVMVNGPAADWLPNEGKMDFKAEKIDDYTVKLIFANPNGVFLYSLAQWNGRHLTWFPKHYLSQFHKKYNPDVDELVAKEEGVEDWVGLLNKKACGPTDDTNNFFLYPERPTLFPWIVTQPLGGGTTVLMERNPYYWKVDTKATNCPISCHHRLHYRDTQSRTLAMLNSDLTTSGPLLPTVSSSMPWTKASRSRPVICSTTRCHQHGPIQSLADPVKPRSSPIITSALHVLRAQPREIIGIAHAGRGSQPGPLESSRFTMNNWRPIH
jgi:ABC-type transport system substrate-binding protein